MNQFLLKRYKEEHGFTQEDYFWSKVIIKSPEECWIWQGYLRNGYGKFYDVNIKKIITAHRYAWEITNGKIPDGLKALHKCDNPSCVNPNHIFLGTQVDNIMDMCSKGRQSAPRGEKVHTCVLNEEKVRKIREMYADGQRQVDIAKFMGVSKGAIRFVVKRMSWDWVQ